MNEVWLHRQFNRFIVWLHRILKWLTGLFVKKCKHPNKRFQYNDNRVKDQKVFWCPDCFKHIFIKK